MKLLTGNSNKVLSKNIAKYLKSKLVNSSIRKFADGEIYVEINENIRGNSIFIIQSISSPANDNLMELLLCIDALKRSSAKNITAVIPYFGYARQDRKVVPRTSISAKLVSNLITKAGADRVVTVDVMDGHFVPNLTIGPPVIKALKKQSSMIFDVHLMISPVHKYIDAYSDAGADIITIHPEATDDLSLSISKIKQLNKKVGVSLNPETKVDVIREHLSEIDLVLIMSVNPGFGGQKFMPEVLVKIKELKEIQKTQNLNFDIEIDGGINFDNSKEAIEAGANILVSGTTIFKSNNGDIKKNIELLKSK